MIFTSSALSPLSLSIISTERLWWDGIGMGSHKWWRRYGQSRRSTFVDIEKNSRKRPTTGDEPTSSPFRYTRSSIEEPRGLHREMFGCLQPLTFGTEVHPDPDPLLRLCDDTKGSSLFRVDGCPQWTNVTRNITEKREGTQ